MPKDPDAAATRIQARYRGNKVRTQRQKAIAGITRLQTQQRGRYSRRAYAQLLAFAKEQHTAADQLETFRVFQRKRSACVIQRAWRATNPSGTASSRTRRAKSESLADRILAFDPFYVGGYDAKGNGNTPRDNALREQLRMQATADHRQQHAPPATMTAPPRMTSSSSEKHTRRRELYERLVQMRLGVSRLVHEFEKTSRATCTVRELRAAELVASCANRLAELQHSHDDESDPLRRPSTSLDTVMALIPSERLEAQKLASQAATRDWDDQHKAEVWRHHRDVVHAVMSKTKWWQTTIAGSERDIRDDHHDQPPSHDEAEDASDPLSIFTFQYRQQHHGNDVITPVNNATASEWWRAHCMHRHLPVGGNSNNDEEEDYRARYSPKALANPVFYRVSRMIEAMSARLENQVSQRVGEVEMQIEVNTRLQMEIEARRQHVKQRRSKEERAAVTIQRTYRGAQGRIRAKEIRAEYFIMVRGRAIRKGKCEECGEAQAVLECKECEESLHFCPLCWVQVHPTRRRKMHVAIPMAVAVPQTAKPVPISKPELLSSSSATGSSRVHPADARQTVDSTRGSSDSGVKAKDATAAAATRLSQKPIAASQRRTMKSALDMKKERNAGIAVDSAQGELSFGEESSAGDCAALPSAGDEDVGDREPSASLLIEVPASVLDSKREAAATSKTEVDAGCEHNRANFVVDASSPLEQTSDNAVREKKDDALPLTAAEQVAMGSSVDAQESDVAKKPPVKASAPARLGVKQRLLSASGPTKKNDDAESKKAVETVAVDGAQASEDGVGVTSGEEPLVAHNNTKPAKAPAAPRLSLKQRMGSKSSAQANVASEPVDPAPTMDTSIPVTPADTHSSEQMQGIGADESKPPHVSSKEAISAADTLSRTREEGRNIKPGLPDRPLPTLQKMSEALLLLKA
ncbi:hypothetical protein FI667_g5986, partial [Globisporangium splendens]